MDFYDVKSYDHLLHENAHKIRDTAGTMKLAQGYKDGTSGT